MNTMNGEPLLGVRDRVMFAVAVACLPLGVPVAVSLGDDGLVEIGRQFSAEMLRLACEHYTIPAGLCGEPSENNQ